MKNGNTVLWIIGIIVLVIFLTNGSFLKKEDITSEFSVRYYDKYGNEISVQEEKIETESKIESFFEDLISSISSLIESFAIVSYVSQCSLSSCPAGYTSINTYCEDTLNTCYRQCEKVTAGSCGSYGSFSLVEWEDISSDYYFGNVDTPDFDMNANTCYKFRGVSFFCLADGTGSYYYQEVELRGRGTTCDISHSEKFNFFGNALECSQLNVFCTWGKSSGDWIYARGDIGSKDISSWQDASMEVELFAATASWTEGFTENAQTSCAYQCDSDTECGTDNFVGNNYCSGGDVYRTWRDYSCGGSSCDYIDSEELIEICSGGYICSGGQCILEPIVEIDFAITLTNIGEVIYENVLIESVVYTGGIDKPGNLLWFYIDGGGVTYTGNIAQSFTTSSYTFNPGDSQTFTSLRIEVLPEWGGQTVTFTVAVYGTNEFTGELERWEAQIDLNL